jgi:hypothetical protein
VATEQIVQSLSYITWALLGALGLGSIGLVWLLAQATDATRGFLWFSALVAGVIAILWYLTETSLPPPSTLAIAPADDLAEARRVATAGTAVLAIVTALRLRRDTTARWWGLAAIGVGVLAMALAAWGWTTGSSMALPFLIVLLAVSAVTGGSLAALVLSHWYLVTPRISERPLLLATRALTWALIVQILLFATWQVVPLDGGLPFADLTGPNALLVWLRLIVGLLFPLVLTVMAHRTALTRSMESATGLLYIEFAAVLASTIVAAGLLLAEGVLV